MNKYLKKLFISTIFYGFLFINLVVLTGNAFADPNVLLGEAIKNAAKLKGKLPTKERLEAYENIFKSLDKIVAEHSSSDQAIKILSDQKIGNFNPPTLRTAYIKDLTEYYDTVCEASPSYSCLGFVSLKTGNEQCLKADNFEEIVEAHLNLQNAAKVFIGQKQNQSYTSLAMDSYRSCLNRSSFKPTTFASDYFAYGLLELLLKSNQTSLAKATIEDMETPYFKFNGVLDLSAHNDKVFDDAFWGRMKKYIEKKIKDKDGEAAMANIALTLNAVRRSSLPIDYQKAYNTVQKYREWGGVKCDHFFSRTVFEMLTTLQTELIGLSRDRKKFNSAQAPTVMVRFADAPKVALSACMKDGLYDYYLMTLIHGQLLLDDPKIAAEFKQRALKEFFTSREQLEFFINHFGKTEKKFELLFDKKTPFPKFEVEKILDRKNTDYFVFTKRVDFSDVCEASRILFKDLKGGDDFDLAIKYMINSPRVDPNAKYKCGDEDLELLLQ